MDYENLNLPEITPVILVLWGICIFIAGYFYRHTPLKNRIRFITTFSVISTLFFFILLYFWYKDRPPFNPIRLAIYPFTTQEDISKPISWESLAFSEISINYINQANPEKLLPYQLDWIFTAANIDSLALPSYLLDFSKRIKLDYAVLGKIIKKTPQFLLDFQIFKIENNETVFSQKLTVKSGEFNNFSGYLSEIILEKVLGTKNHVDVKNNWKSNAQLKNYFLAKFMLFNENTELAFKFGELAVKEDSTSAICLNLLAELYMKRGYEVKNKGESPLNDYNRAKTILQKALLVEKTQSTSLWLMAELYLMNKKWNQAEDYLRDALIANPMDPRIYFDFTQLYPSRYEDLGFKNEKDLLIRAIYINPCFFEARLTLANYYDFKNRQDLVLNEINKVLFINPKSLDGLMALGKFYITQNDMLNILQTYEKIINLEPDHEEAYYNLGIVYYHAKDYDTAIKYFKKAIQLGDHLDSYLYLAYIYEIKGEIDKAIDYLRIRIRKRTNEEDRFAEEARKHLFQIMSQRGAIDSIMSKISH